MIPIPSLILIFILLATPSAGLAQESPQPPGSTLPETGVPGQSTPQTNSGSEPSDTGSGSTQKPGSTKSAEPAPSQESPPSSGSSPQKQAVGQEKTSEQAPGTAPDQAPAQAPGPSPTTEEQAAPEQKAPEKVLEASEEEKKRTVSTAVEQTGITLIRGRLEIDSGLSYTHSSSNQLLIEGFGILPILTIGNISVQRIRRDTWTATVSARYKLTPDLQVSVTIPYSYALTRISEATGIEGGSVATPNTDNLNRGWGLGDVSGGLSYQVLTEGPVRPAIYVGASFRGRTGRDSFETRNPAQNAPTGSGFNIIGLSANFVKVADPAVVSGSFVYGHPLSRNNVVFENQGNPVKIDVDPGDSYSISLGLGYALNYKVSLSTNISQAVGLPTKINGTKLNNSLSNAITLGYGLTWRWSERTSLGISVTQGLTLDTPDVSIGFRIPYRF